MNLSINVAVYAEHSDSTKPMVKGWNIRVFNRTEVREGYGIHLQDRTGVVRLEPGLYHITAVSSVTYADPTAEDQTRVPTSPNPFGGYCRLRYQKDEGCPNEDAIAIGTIGNANMVPSMIETYLKVNVEAGIVLEHQVGDNVDGIYLQVNAGNSPWHAFARIAIRRVG